MKCCEDCSKNWASEKGFLCCDSSPPPSHFLLPSFLWLVDFHAFATSFFLLQGERAWSLRSSQISCTVYGPPAKTISSAEHVIRVSSEGLWCGASHGHIHFALPKSVCCSPCPLQNTLSMAVPAPSFALSQGLPANPMAAFRFWANYSPSGWPVHTLPAMAPGMSVPTTFHFQVPGPLHTHTHTHTHTLILGKEAGPFLSF